MFLINNDKLSKKQHIRMDIELKILLGIYKPGDLVPSIRVMAKFYNVGTSTTQLILDHLAKDKILVMDSGIGFRVNHNIYKSLLQKHKKTVEELFNYACEYAHILNLNPEDFIT